MRSAAWAGVADDGLSRWVKKSTIRFKCIFAILFTVGANLAGVPAISLPAGLDEQGLPVAIQLQAPVLEESRLLFAGAAFQAATDHHKLRPTSDRESPS